MGCDSGGNGDAGRCVPRFSGLLNPAGCENTDRAHAIGHIITPDGVCSIPHNAPGELVIAMVKAAAARWGYPVDIDLPVR